MKKKRIHYKDLSNIVKYEPYGFDTFTTIMTKLKVIEPLSQIHITLPKSVSQTSQSVHY